MTANLKSITFKTRLSAERWAEVAAWLSREGKALGYQGAYEGTALAEGEHADAVDSAEAPGTRDWIRDRQSEAGTCDVELYFDAQQAGTSDAQRTLDRMLGCEGEWSELADQDWNATWKAAFTGISLSGGWRVLPPWMEDGQSGQLDRVIVINPGAGFGTGSHETTRLCLETLWRLSLKGQRVLDFGAGSGILGIAASRWGARSVDAVEVDALAIENLNDNAELNGVSVGVTTALRAQASGHDYGVVVANILEPVLMEYRSDLIRRWDPHAHPSACMILSGLLAEAQVVRTAEAYRIEIESRWKQSCHVHIETMGDWALAQLHLQA